jgi:hypothetical protein
MKIFSLFREENKFEIVVYDSLKDFTSGTEWQDILGDYVTIIDKSGNIYKWDDSKKEEYATVNNFTLKIVESDLELGKLCQEKYEQNEFSTEFSFEI